MIVVSCVAGAHGMDYVMDYVVQVIALEVNWVNHAYGNDHTLTHRHQGPSYYPLDQVIHSVESYASPSDDDYKTTHGLLPSQSSNHTHFVITYKLKLVEELREYIL